MRLTRTIGASACVWLALTVSCSSGDHRGSGGGAGGGSGGGAVGGGGGGGAGGTGGGSAGGAGTCVTCDPTRANNSCGLSGCECAGGAQCPVGISCAEGGSTGGASGGPIGSVCVDNHPWHPVTSATTPRQRYAAAMTFDAKRNKTVLFGGIDNGTFLGDTWEYDGTDWTQVADAGPSAGAYAAMFFDPVRQRVDLYGDPGDGGMDGWSWDGTTWTRLGSTPLGGRMVTAIWDTTRSRAVALVTSDCGAQTWERSGMTWTKNPDAGAIPKNGALAYDPSTQRSVYFGADPLPPRSEGVGGGAGGGVDAGCALELGTWEYDGQVWSHVTTAGSPTLPILYGHRMIYLPTSSSIALIGGASSTFAPFPQYLWRYSDHAWTKYAGPYWQPRYLHGIAWDSARQKVVFFGGTNGNNALDDTWEY